MKTDNQPHPLVFGGFPVLSDAGTATWGLRVGIRGVSFIFFPIRELPPPIKAGPFAQRFPAQLGTSTTNVRIQGRT